MSTLNKSRRKLDPKTPGHGWKLGVAITKAITAIAIAIAAVAPAQRAPSCTGSASAIAVATILKHA